MQLFLNTYGAYLHKRDNCFLVKNGEKTFEISANKVDSIWITTSATLSTDAVKFAVDNNIDISFLDHFGNPYGRVWHSKLGSTTLIRRRQLQVSDDERGLTFVKEWNQKKMNNQIDFLKKISHTRPEQSEKIHQHINRMTLLRNESSQLSGTIETERQSILGIEGMVSRCYFNVISEIMPEKWKFEERSRRPAKDGFNCTLNYGYGVLYSMVERACILAGLDPYVGILHTDNYNKKSFVFDVIEIFRTHVDEPVVYLFTKKMMHESYFDPIKDGVSLNKQGKEILIKTLNSHFDQKIPYMGRSVKMRNTIQMECHAIAKRMIEEGQDAGLGTL